MHVISAMSVGPIPQSGTAASMVWALKALIAAAILSPVSPPQHRGRSMCPHALPDTKHYPSFALSQSDREKMCFIVILICISSNTIKIEHIFIH